jgi:hypothetical protein
MTTFQYGDIGVNIEVQFVDESETPIDVSLAVVTRILYRKPDGTSSYWTATKVNGGTTGRIAYTTLASDLNQVGEWQIQGYYELGASEKYHSVTAPFYVKENA